MTLTTKDKILDAAEKRVRGVGFATMSFRDLAEDVGIKSASVHYHFPTKPDLGEALVDRYSSQFKNHLDKIDRGDLQAALKSFVALYSDALVVDESICLCAIMGAEAIGLPKEVNQKTKAFFQMNCAWLRALFEHHGVLAAEDNASLIVAALEGGMIVASTSRDHAFFEQIAKAAIRRATEY
ncbi:TetR/AcrR family transcriptional regulator [Sulfitobacter mediterraneus]|uniref:TetR/AcrR family transcriptional regulator n=1 Tax=Sulfitobacter mediterraneus TaxID=83219 RepID=UPI000D554EBB|nr:TetR/AcrR family transcriptional regulator [Sulfitobacter mediterraneus]UWR12017.1 TetR/AcrR family transcriptional regulator [Sulfitobacter mediterraneus]